MKRLSRIVLFFLMIMLAPQGLADMPAARVFLKLNGGVATDEMELICSSAEMQYSGADGTKADSGAGGVGDATNRAALTDQGSAIGGQAPRNIAAPAPTTIRSGVRGR